MSLILSLLSLPLFSPSSLLLVGCTVDPLSTTPQKALEQIGMRLQQQYERWQPKARYKQLLDPTLEDIKKVCTSYRRNAKVGKCTHAHTP